jgi:hypothetical protein
MADVQQIKAAIGENERARQGFPDPGFFDQLRQAQVFP